LASSVIGPIIPPSIVMVVYSAATGVSTGRMFLAGVVPGLMTGLVLMIYVFVVAKFGLEPGPEPKPFRTVEVLKTGRRAFFPLLAPAIIIGGMVSGMFTPTEAGVVAAFYVLLLGILSRELNLGRIGNVMAETAASSASILYLIAVSAIMGWIVTVEGTARDLVAMLPTGEGNKVGGLLAINLALLAIGCVIETTAAILICSSLLLPVALALGLDPVHFGVILCFNLLLGMMTPPMGVGLYVMSNVGKVPVGAILRATIPFFIPLLVALGLITFVPELSLWLPRLVFGS
jgi:tripartite ATP-independent transporter DctM subunit